MRSVDFDGWLVAACGAATACAGAAGVLLAVGTGGAAGVFLGLVSLAAVGIGGFIAWDALRSSIWRD